jgi:septal ring factor EnvC (AmiA/AmiB activator)
MMQGGGGKGGRQNPKTKISTLTQQLKELEEELAAVEKDCAQLDEENKALLEQAQAREAEVERERAKIARAMPPQGAPVLFPPPLPSDLEYQPVHML